jgi:fibronectin-binding autotransporter adhesin
MNVKSSRSPTLASAIRVALATGLLAGTPARAVVVFDGFAGVDPLNGFMYVGDVQSGSAVVTAPGPNTYSTITLANQFVSTAIGSVLVTGVGAVLNATNVFNIGGLGNATMRIENGGVANSLGGESPFCPGCNSTSLGTGGGANGTLVVTGAGSRFTTADALGNSAVFIVGHGNVSSTYGNAGAPTSGTMSILSGGAASTLSAIVGNANNHDASLQLGRSKTTGIVNVDGAGAVWTVAPMANGIPAFIALGRYGSGALNISGGGRVETTHMQIGSFAGSTGALNVSGTGSLLQMIGGDAVYGGAGFVVGWKGGATGTVSVTGGGRIFIDGTDSGGSAGMSVGGLHDAPGGTGSVTVSGVGSLIEIIGNSTGGGPSGFTAGVTGAGYVSVLAGGRIVITDNSPDAFGSFSVGGNLAQAAAGTPAGNGTLLVSGAGSEVDVRSAHGSFRVGHTGGSTGTLIVEAGGRIKAASGIVGDFAGSTGTMTLKGADSRVDLAGDSYGFGAFLVVAAAGTGTLDVTDGATLSIQASAAAPYGGMAVGGTRTMGPGDSGGTGTVNVSNGARILVGGDSGTHVKLGSYSGGSAVMNVTGGGQVIVDRPPGPMIPGDERGFFVANGPGATGVAIVRGEGSIIDAGVFLGVGVAVDKVS